MTGLAAIFAAAALAASPNPIVAENAFQGSDPAAWLEPAYPPTSVQGYTSELSVLAGEDVHFHVSTNDGDRYRIEVYRLGWYGGSGARLLICLPNCGGDEAGRTYGRPETDPVTHVVRAGWPVTDTLSVPTTWVTRLLLRPPAGNERRQRYRGA